MKFVKYIALIGAVCAAFTVQPAKADFVSLFDLGNEGAVGNFPGPYAKLVISLDSTGSIATFTLTSLTNSGNIYLMGSSLGFDVNATTFTATGISGTNSGTGFTPGGFSSTITPGLTQAGFNGFGKFNLTVTDFDGFTHSVDTLLFTVTNTGGTWASAANVLAFNDAGVDAATHIFVTTSPADAGNGASVTGFSAESTGGVVTPDNGTTVMLLGLGLSGLGFVRRFVKR